KKTPLTKLNLKSSLAKGEACAFSLSGKSKLPLYNNLFTRNFIVAGFGVLSVYTLMVAISI
ncbi:MAG TPA: hypothetical protein VN040_21890, partial [Pseudosphingobacterium sp.]|nr:hypothetical protein [Pseudosphingobacterium sp.]